jgi:outer membrane lipoprotein-sorting protein
MVAENSTDQSVSGEKKVIVSNTKIKLIDGIKAVKNSEIKSSLKDITDGKLKLDSSDNLNAGDIIVDEKTGMAVRIKSVDSKNTAETEPANLGSIFDSVEGGWSVGGRFKADLK